MANSPTKGSIGLGKHGALQNMLYFIKVFPIGFPYHAGDNNMILTIS